MRMSCRNTHIQNSRMIDRSRAAEWEVMSSSQIQKESHQQEILKGVGQELKGDKVELNSKILSW